MGVTVVGLANHDVRVKIEEVKKIWTRSLEPGSEEDMDHGLEPA